MYHDEGGGGLKDAFKKKKRKYELAEKYAYPKLKRPQVGKVKYHRRLDMR